MAIFKLNPQIQFANGTYSSRYVPIFLLEGVRYGFRFYTIVNDADKPVLEVKPDGWSVDLFEPNSNTNTVTGIRLSVGVDLFFKYRYKGVSRVPPGKVFVGDLKNTKWDAEIPGFQDIRGYDPNAQGFEDDLYGVFYLTSDEG